MAENENKNILDLLLDIKELTDTIQPDAEKTLKGNKTAGIRLRKQMQEIKRLCQDVRDKVQVSKNVTA